MRKQPDQSKSKGILQDKWPRRKKYQCHKRLNKKKVEELSRLLKKIKEAQQITT